MGNAVEAVAILPEKISGESRLKILKNKTKRTGAARTEKFRPGDFVVHLDHGVGIFKEETAMSAGKNSEEEKYLVLEYAPSRKNGPKDKLYVPERQTQKLSRYIGFVRPKISRLGTELWLKTKHKIKEEVEKFARELLELYAKREISKRPAYHDAHFQKELIRRFENSFEHIDTPDQQKAWKNVKKDLESERPLDRIICGDVGFGKTEIALRAAFAAVASGYQAAVLCPTTILADQHFETFSERLKNFPVNLALLSRFEPHQKQKETLEKLKSGGVDIVVGTHRLLSKDIEFKNLRLLVIDEEQKFGLDFTGGTLAEI
ncbi:MAG: DEAD/DEAH box helicase, partial [Patescibacteria group bacterium]